MSAELLKKVSARAVVMSDDCERYANGATILALMGSISAMKSGSSDRYFQKGTKNKKLVPEGIEGMVPVKGPLSELVHQLLGGIRSSMGYCGARDLQDFIKKVEFIKITSSGIVESHPHDLDVTKEAPNYRKPY